MMSAKGMVMSAVALAVAGGTYFSLDAIAPSSQEVVQAQAADAVPVEQVFAGKLDTTPPPAPAAQPVIEPAAPVEAVAMAGPESMPETMPEPMPESTLESMEPEPMPASTEPEPMEAEPAQAMEPETMTAEPAMAEPETMAMVEPATTSVQPKPAASKPKASAPPKAWWGAERPDGLSLIFAGSAAYKKAIVLMFNSAFDTTDSAAQNIEVKDGSGKHLSGSWELGANNKRMLLFPVQKSGTYQVVVNQGLTDRQGRSLATSMQGPVAVE